MNEIIIHHDLNPLDAAQMIVTILSDLKVKFTVSEEGELIVIKYKQE